MLSQLTQSVFWICVQYDQANPAHQSALAGLSTNLQELRWVAVLKYDSCSSWHCLTGERLG